VIKIRNENEKLTYSPKNAIVIWAHIVSSHCWGHNVAGKVPWGSLQSSECVVEAWGKGGGEERVLGHFECSGP
jgi:hypothetical protein